MAYTIFYFGGQKSGKTAHAITHIKKITKNYKPYYIATYDNSYNDDEMQERIDAHILERSEDFITLEETHNLEKVIEDKKFYIVDCVSMWLLNEIDNDEDFFKKRLQKIFETEATIIFVLNDVSCGVIPMDKISRKFVDLSGKIGAFIASNADEVYQVNFGIKTRIK